MCYWSRMTTTEETKENKKMFCKRVRSFASPSDVVRVKLAYMLAKHLHRSQTRKEKDDEGNNIRYFEHVRRVAIILMDEFHVVDPDLVIAALLHDTLEDCADMSEEIIEHCFGKRVCFLVKGVTKTKHNKKNYYGFLKNMAKDDNGVAVIKAADRIDNLRTIEGCEIEFIKKQVKETFEVVMPTLCSILSAESTAYQVLDFQADGLKHYLNDNME